MLSSWIRIYSVLNHEEPSSIVPSVILGFSVVLMCSLELKYRTVERIMCLPSRKIGKW